MPTLMNDQYQISAQDSNPVGGTAIYGAVYFCQSFTPSVTGNLTAVHLAMSKSGSPGSLEVLIYLADGSDKPTGSVLASQVVSSSGLPTGIDPANLDVTFSSPASLTASTKYVIVCRQQSDAGDLFNSIRWFGTGNTDSNYSGGTQHYSTNSGSTWNNQTKDFTFVTTMSVAVATPGLDRWAYGSHPNGSAERIQLSTERKAQTFVPSVTQPLKKLLVRFYRIDSQTGGNVNFEIYAVDGSNKPTGSALAVQSVADTSIPTSNILSGLEVVFTTPAELTAGTTYAFVINCPNASGSARYSVAHSGSSPDSYTGGQSWASTDSGSTWTHDTSARDLAFGTFMLEPDTTITGLRRDQYSLNALQTDLATNVTVSGPSLDDELYAQLFTPSVTGNLVKIHVPVRRIGTTSTGDMQFAIKAVSAGIPTGADLATANITAASIPDTNEFYIKSLTLSTPVALTASTQYAIVARALTNGNYRWYSGNAGTLYSGGQAMYSLDGGANWTQQSTEDLAFVTEMDVTIPQPGLDQFGFGTNVGGGNDTIDSSTEYRGQTFVPTISTKLKGVKLGLRRNTGFTGGTVTIEIQETTAGLPNGSVLATTSVSDASLPTVSGTITQFDFTSAPDLTAGTTYAIVIKFPGAGANVYSLLHADEGQGSSSGQGVISTNSGSTWTAETGGPNDLLFATIMFAPTVTSQTINSDATIEIETTQTILSDAFHGAISSQTINSDAVVYITTEQTIFSDAFHGQETTQTIFSDASIGVTQSVDIFSDAFVGQETNQTIFSDTTVFITTQQTILSASTIFITSLQTILSSANIFASVVQTINANASVAMTTTQTITGGAVITVKEPVLKLYVVV